LPSHGSLTKAGKVRSITPKTESKNNSSPNPRVGNRKAYNRRIILGRNGQYQPGGGRYGHRRWPHTYAQRHLCHFTRHQARMV